MSEYVSTLSFTSSSSPSHASNVPSSSPSASSSSSSSSSSALNHVNTISLDLQLKWFRFTCIDMNRMMEFWMNVLKLHMDRQVEVGSRIHTTFFFPGDKVGVRFEYDQYQKLAFKQAAGHHGAHALPKYPLTNIALIIYVDNLSEIMSRVHECHFVVYIEPSIISHDPLIRCASILDPNGIHIKLMEGSVYHLNKSKLRARLGYLTFPVKDYSVIEKCRRFYEETFQTKPSAASNNNSNAKGAVKKDDAQSHVRNNSEFDNKMSKIDLITALHQDTKSYTSSLSSHHSGSGSGSGSGSSVPSKGHSTTFRVVDAERFVERLHSYVWLGNGTRKRHPTLCLVHKLQRRMMAPTTKSNNFSSSKSNKFMRYYNNSKSNVSSPTNLSQSAANLLTMNQQQNNWTEMSNNDFDYDDDDDEEREAIEKIQAQVALLDRKFNEHSDLDENKIFLGLSFYVNDLDLAIGFLKKCDMISSSRLEIQHIPGFPRFISLFDPAYLPIELWDGSTTSHLLGAHALQHAHAHNTRVFPRAAHSYAQRQSAAGGAGATAQYATRDGAVEEEDNSDPESEVDEEDENRWETSHSHVRR